MEANQISWPCGAVRQAPGTWASACAQGRGGTGTPHALHPWGARGGERGFAQG